MKSDHPGFTVLVPLHNQGSYVVEALESALAQTYPELEVLVIENGSTDAGPELAREFSRQHPERVRFLTLSGRPSLARARNLGIDEARYEWLALLDADDWWREDKLERQWAFKQRVEAETGRRIVALGAFSYHIGATGKVAGVYETRLNTVEDFDRRRARGGLFYMSSSTVLLDRSAVLEVGKYDPDYDGTEDVDLYSRLADHDPSWIILNMPEHVSFYRVHDQTYSTGGFVRQQMNAERVRANIARRRIGERELSYEEFVARLQEDPWWRKVNRWRKLKSREEYRIAGGALSAGRIGRGGLHLSRAIALGPFVVAGRMRRQIVPRIASRLGVNKPT